MSINEYICVYFCIYLHNHLYLCAHLCIYLYFDVYRQLRCNMRGIAETSGAWSDLLGPKCHQRPYWSPSSCIQDKGDYITAAGGPHPSHVIITTCVGLRKRRARDRICLHIMFVDASAIAAEPRRPLDSCKSRVPHGTESANMTTHACTNASANFFNSIRARSQDSERVARRNNMPQRAAS